MNEQKVKIPYFFLVYIRTLDPGRDSIISQHHHQSMTTQCIKKDNLTFFPHIPDPNCFSTLFLTAGFSLDKETKLKYRPVSVFIFRCAYDLCTM